MARRSQDRPVIGLTTQTLQSIDGIPADLPQSWVMNQRYFHAVINVGAVPWMIPLLHDDLDTLRAIYDRLDGLLIPGGVDMDPATYGEAKHPKTGNLDPARDTVELQLTRWAIEDRKPLLGLCRGAQVINVALGGSLWQDLEACYPDSIKHDYFPIFGFARDHLAHDVQLARGSRLAHLTGRDRVLVNSMHHQGLRRLGDRLTPTAVAPDGLVEAVELEGQWLVGVQWHPEMFELTYEPVRELFGEFVREAAA